MNKVTLVGRLTKDPELRTTNSGKSVCRFTVAVDRRFKQEGQPTADFIPIVAWNRQAEVIKQYLTKGRQIALAGHIQTGSFTAQDGSKRYTTEVILDEFDFIGGSNGSGNYNASSFDSPSFGGNNAPLDLSDDDFHLLAEDDDVPF